MSELYLFILECQILKIKNLSGDYTSILTFLQQCYCFSENLFLRLINRYTKKQIILNIIGFVCEGKISIFLQELLSIYLEVFF